ncbi:helix-turn-helix domain-containing protein [Kitasatospora sp. NPDC059571]|uniref:helix-turn-helix domain-containing protein n=1 Tax=Kitasatospora sp. NPDC059571 TaxID=3346871 RepID=UPI0036BA4455
MGRTDASDDGVQARRTAIDELAGALRGLRMDAGEPSFRAMARASGRVSATTLHDAVSGTRLPTWPTVAAFVDACGDDSAAWKQQWSRAARVCHPEQGAPDSATAPAKAAAPSAAEEPVPPEAQVRPAPPPVSELRSTRPRGPLVLTMLVGIMVGACAASGISAWVTPEPRTCPAMTAVVKVYVAADARAVNPASTPGPAHT